MTLPRGTVVALLVLSLAARGQSSAQARVDRQHAVLALEEATAQQLGAGSGVVLGVKFPDQRGLAERATADVVGEAHQRVRGRPWARWPAPGNSAPLRLLATCSS